MRTLNVDKVSLKKKIKEKLYQNIEGNYETNLLKNDIFDYNQEKSKYIREEFNSKIIDMILIYLNEKRLSNDFPIEFKQEVGFINKFVTLVKYLLLNELEFAALTVLIDKFGWTNEKIENHWNYFCILGIKAKGILRSEDMSLNLLEKVKRTNYKFEDYYTEWINEEYVINEIPSLINKKTINEAFIRLNHPTNSYCRKNYINYNGVVDKIIKLSQPYGDHNNGYKIQIKEEWEGIENGDNINNNKESEDIIQNNFGIYNSNNFLNDLNSKRLTSTKFLTQNIYGQNGTLLMPIFVGKNSTNSFQSGIFNSKNPSHNLSMQGSNSFL